MGGVRCLIVVGRARFCCGGGVFIFVFFVTFLAFVLAPLFRRAVFYLIFSVRVSLACIFFLLVPPAAKLPPTPSPPPSTPDHALPIFFL